MKSRDFTFTLEVLSTGSVRFCPVRPLSLWWVVTATWPLAIPADPPIISPHAKINRLCHAIQTLYGIHKGPLTEE
jgi:hypothetical protein